MEGEKCQCLGDGIAAHWEIDESIEPSSQTGCRSATIKIGQPIQGCPTDNFANQETVFLKVRSKMSYTPPGL